MKRSYFLIALVFFQAVCALFFVAEIVLTILGARSAPIPWQTRELLEIGAALGLVLGVVLGGVTLRRTLAEKARAEKSLQQVQTAFRDHLGATFDGWALTPAERDVALFSIKGLSVQEIADLRNTSDGTVKAQCNAIYRKAGVTGRAQLMSLFLEDLLAEDTVWSTSRTT
ncbi:LuxR C-terminal-related transcriptional regulator [Shimia sp.]|uniref:helix-turn-helix transcriptional regulator n=1 Tax=Shimia sp. TaxID=1954381 RepID=UPI003299F706